MKGKPPIILGILGAVLGYAGTLLLLVLAGFGNRADPIMTGFLVLIVFGPAGALGGLLLGVKAGMSLRGSEGSGSFTANSLKALAIVIATVAVVGGGYAFYEIQTATPWLRPAGVVLQFEIRLPAGSAAPPVDGVKAELQTSVNTMPAKIYPDQFRSDGGRPVVVGQVDVAYRTKIRQVEVSIPGRTDQTYPIRLAAEPPHMSAFGPWQPQPDGSEIRYRAIWPGED